MFPGVSGFHWSPTHVVFLTIFGLVLSTVAATVALALLRTRRSMRRGLREAILWQQDFADLPENERRCRHALTGTAPARACARALDCRMCPEHPGLEARERGRSEEVPGGLNYPLDRYYHRGHTWVKPLEDGTLALGLDDLGRRIAGRVDCLELPKVGDRLTLNGPAWRMAAGRRRMSLRSPVDGRVVALGGIEGEWLLQVQPDEATPNLAHLLYGREVSAWLRAELERLQVLVSPATTGPALADGGSLQENLPGAMPKARWDDVADAMFLRP